MQMVNTAILYRELQVVTSQASPSFVPSSEELQSGTKLVRKEAKGEQPVSFIMMLPSCMDTSSRRIRWGKRSKWKGYRFRPTQGTSCLSFASGSLCGGAAPLGGSVAVISSKGRSLGLERGARGCRYETLLLAYGLFTGQSGEADSSRLGLYVMPGRMQIRTHEWDKHGTRQSINVWFASLTPSAFRLIK
jgi:hypothetical protein